MQSVPLNIPVGTAQLLQCDGFSFFFESGATSTTDQYIIVTPQTGSELVVKPGQSFRLTEKTSFWTVKAHDPAALITGRVVIGYGEFQDSNGTVSLAGSLNSVNINNDTAHAVPVLNTNTNAQALPVAKQALGTIVNIAPVVVGVANTALSSDATLRMLRIKNTHATAKVAIGATGVTLAAAAIVLSPGDVWLEEDAAGAAWYAISDTAATTVALQGVK